MCFLGSRNVFLESKFDGPWFWFQIHNEDGVWVRLHSETMKEYCGAFYQEAWCLQYNQHLNKTLLLPMNQTKPPPEPTVPPDQPTPPTNIVKKPPSVEIMWVDYVDDDILGQPFTIRYTWSGPSGRSNWWTHTLSGRPDRYGWKGPSVRSTW
jgi:hypothetical protein